MRPRVSDSDGNNLVMFASFAINAHIWTDGDRSTTLVSTIVRKLSSYTSETAILIAHMPIILVYTCRPIVETSTLRSTVCTGLILGDVTATLSLSMTATSP